MIGTSIASQRGRSKKFVSKSHVGIMTVKHFKACELIRRFSGTGGTRVLNGIARRRMSGPIIRRSVAVMLACVLLCAGMEPLVRVSGRSAKAQEARHIIICVDGVGFSLIEKMRAEGRFKMFRAPSRMISPFPTLTNLSMSEILEPAGAGKPAGYEDNYFDAERNKLRGGILDRLRGGRFVRGTFRELFDYHPSALKSGLGYAAPPMTIYLEALSDLVRLRQKARASRVPIFFAYTGATDSLAHLGGEGMLRSFLNKLDDSLSDIVRDGGEPVSVTIFSDHGNHFRKYRRAKLKSPLKGAGFRLEKSVRDRRSVVLPQFGLIGCALLFTMDENEARIAEVAAAIRGVDFTTYEKDGIVYILDANGRATIEKRGNRYRYEALKDDPLDIAGTARALASKGKADEQGFIGDAEWFEATRDAARPDAVRRVYEGATSGAINRANVIVSFEDGYYSGSASLDVFAFLQATHGNLGREQSYGFLMSTEHELQPFIRAEDLWTSIGSPRLNKSLHSPHNAHADELFEIAPATGRFVASP